MPFVFASDRLNYHREWCAQRRAAWLAEHGPCVACGSDQQLELDRIDSSGEATHRIWTWAPKRRDAELAKYQVLCHECRVDKFTALRRARAKLPLRGRSQRRRPLTAARLAFWNGILATTGGRVEPSDPRPLLMS